MAKVTVIDVTEKLNVTLGREFPKVVKALGTLGVYFDRELRSSAIAEISESLVAKHVGGQKTPRSSRGYDVKKGTRLIEVKARLRGRYGDSVLFSFGRHTINAHEVYALAWDWEAKVPKLVAAYKLRVAVLSDLFGTANQVRYCARTTLRKLKLACLPTYRTRRVGTLPAAEISRRASV